MRRRGGRRDFLTEKKAPSYAAAKDRVDEPGAGPVTALPPAALTELSEPAAALDGEGAPPPMVGIKGAPTSPSHPVVSARADDMEKMAVPDSTPQSPVLSGGNLTAERRTLSRDHVEKLKVKYLKRILAGREESTEGKKAELVLRTRDCPSPFFEDETYSDDELLEEDDEPPAPAPPAGEEAAGADKDSSTGADAAAGARLEAAIEELDDENNEAASNRVDMELARRAHS